MKDGIQGISNISPDDKSLSEIWEELICDIALKKSDTDMLLGIVKEITPIEAQILSETNNKGQIFIHVGKIKNKLHTESLESKYLIKDCTIRLGVMPFKIVVFSSLFYWVTMALIAFTSLFIDSFVFQNLEFFNENIKTIYIFLAAMILINAFGWFRNRIHKRKYKLTTLGKRLLKSVNE
jgi:hypothetical protein